MKKLLLALTLACLLMLALGAVADAKPPTLIGLSATVAGADSGALSPDWVALAERTSPTASSVAPSAAPNDIDAPVTITGAGFEASPTVSLGATALTNVTFVSATTLTATVPWGMDPGVYALKVVNPDGSNSSLSDAFTVTKGIGQWNGGDLFGGEVRQILLKPGDPTTLYAPANRMVGLFRSTDAGGHWTHVGADVFVNQGKFAIDPFHPTWLYGYAYDGLRRSQDGGDTWTTVMGNTWPDGRALVDGQVYVSPHDPQVLFLSAPGEQGAAGLIKSADGGAYWGIVADMEGIPVQAVAFHPADPLQMVLVTRDARVFKSADGGGTWTEVAKPAISSSSIGFRGVITYNPYKPSEVWIASGAWTGGIYKSADAALSSWQYLSGGGGGGFLTFTSADSVYSAATHSIDGGTTWQAFGPWNSSGEVRFDPDHPQIGYIGNDAYGVEKTTDGGLTWAVKSQGLAGMYCWSVAVSPADSLRVYATFEHWPGIYRSDDGTDDWTYLPIADSFNVRSVREDPFDSQRIYVGADNGFYVSADGGESWSDLGWNTPPSSPSSGTYALEPDPDQPGRLLVGFANGSLCTSTDYGVTWRTATVPQSLTWITDMAFDPETPGVVYITTSGTGVYRSTDSGSSWTRVDDEQQPDMQDTVSIAIASHPQPMVLVETGSYSTYRSLDGGATWTRAKDAVGGSTDYVFAAGDSTRLYAAAGLGLFFSSNAGDTWQRAAGALGGLQTMALGSGNAGDHSILYAATSGGAAGATTGTAVTRRTARGAGSTLVDAGVYRYVQVPAPTVTLKLSGLRRGALKLGKRVAANGKATPRNLAGSKVELKVQKKSVRKWVTVKTVKRVISAKGAYGWKYKPAKKGGYRVQAAIAKTATHASAKTKWRTFKVK
jgi:photosystem II stability/assembly factor-like uncharacterized protein